MIFEEPYPPEATNFCNNFQGTDNLCYIKEIEPMSIGETVSAEVKQKRQEAREEISGLGEEIK